MHYVYLAFAIVAEVIGTTALQMSDGMNKTVPSIVVVIGYGIAFYLLSLALKTMQVGVAYAIWSGVGIVLIALVGMVLFKQRLDAPALGGMALIIAGVIVMNVFSKTVRH